MFDAELSQSSASISAAYLHSILPALAQHYGLDLALLLRNAGLAQEQLIQPDVLVPLFQAGMVFAQILQATGDHGLGLVAGSLVQPRSYQVLGYAVLSSANLGEAVDRLIRYEKLVGKLGSTVLQCKDDRCRLQWHCPWQGDWTRYLKEAAITGWVTYARTLLPATITPLRVCFDHPRLIPQSRYDAVFQCPVLLEQDWCGVEFPADFLALPLHSADPGLRALMDAQAQQLLQDFDGTTNLVNEVRACIAELLPNGEPTLEQVAQRLGLAPRTLQHRLKNSGMAFKDVLETVRKALVLHYLQDARWALIDVAFLLGFSEQSAFSRAFRRWFGESPQAWRKRLG